MPRNVRNFWIELMVDGKATKVATGPRRKDGGFNLMVYQRNEGGIIEAVKLAGREADGELKLWIIPGNYPFAPNKADYVLTSKR